MNRPPYPYDRRYATRYTFVSKGRKGAVLKVVQFSPTSAKNVINLSFGDLQPDGTVNDTVNTNNNDIIRVMATVIEIVNDFAAENPGIKIVFAGGNHVRTSLYFRILKMYQAEFSKTYIITALVKEGSRFAEMPFEPSGNNKYLAFFVRRKQ
jgi:hypothetical protein